MTTADPKKPRPLSNATPPLVPPEHADLLVDPPRIGQLLWLPFGGKKEGA